MKKHLLTALLILAIAAGGYALYREIRGQRADIRALKAADEKAQARIAEKEAANVALLNENVKLRERDAASEVEKLRLRADLQAKTIENKKLRDDLKTAPPEAILAKTQDWLGTREIWLRANAASQSEAVFSLSAFRINADALAEREHFKFTLIPSLQEQLGVSEEQNATKAAVILNLDTIVLNLGEIVIEKNKQIEYRDEAVLALKKRNFWRTVGIAAGSFAAGFILGK